MTFGFTSVADGISVAIVEAETAEAGREQVRRLGLAGGLAYVEYAAPPPDELMGRKLTGQDIGKFLAWSRGARLACH